MKKSINWSAIKSKLSMFTGVLALAAMSNLASANTVCVTGGGKIHCASGETITTSSPAMKELAKAQSRDTFENISIYKNVITSLGYRDNSSDRYFFEWQNLSSSPTETKDSPSYNRVTWIESGTNSTTNNEYQCKLASLVFYCKNKDSSTWLTLSNGTGGRVVKVFKKFALANSHIWAIESNGRVWYKESYTTSTDDWVEVPGSLQSIAVDPTNNTVCGTDYAKNIYCSDWPGNKGAAAIWRKLPGQASSLALYDGKMWSAGSGLFFKRDTSISGGWISQNFSANSVAVYGTETINLPPAPTTPSLSNSDPKIYACVRYLNGSAACANGNSAYTATPTMTNLSKVADANRISMLNIDRLSLVGLGSTASITNAIYDWAGEEATPGLAIPPTDFGYEWTVGETKPGVVVTPTISSDTNATGQKIVWLGSGVNITNGKVYQCRALENGKVSCKDKDASTWLDIAHSNAGFKHLALANSHIWGIAKDNTIWYKSSYQNAVNDWQQIPGSLLNIAVDYKTNTICGNNSNYDIFCADWPSNTGNGVGWRQIAGRAYSVAVFESKVWVVGTDNYMYYKPDTSSKGNWIRTNVSSLAQVTVSGISNLSNGTDLDKGFTWKVQGNKVVAFTLNGQDVQCASNDGRTCLTDITVEQAKQSTTPLVCGTMLKAVSGITGYNTPEHWCHTAANGWIWSPQIGLFWKMTNSGDPQCAAGDGRHCLWGSGKNLKWMVSAAKDPLTCGNEHFWEYGTTGYYPGHWCKYLKDNAGSTTLW